MSTSLMPLPKQQYFDSPNGRPLAGGKVYTYSAGTTTPKATYTDSAGLVPQANPIVLNARGEPDNPIYWSGNYKIVLKDSSGSTIYTVDNYNADPYSVQNILPALAASSGSSLVGFIQAGAGAVARTVQSKCREIASVVDYGASVDGVTDDAGAIAKAIAARALFSLGGGNSKLASMVTTQAGTDMRGVTQAKAGPLIAGADVLTSTALTALTIGGHANAHRGVSISPVTPNSVGGIGVYGQDKYFYTLEDALMQNFETGIKQEKSLYHTYRRVDVTGGTRGAWFYATAGSWNIDWYNNEITLEQCRFLSNTENNLDFQGQGLVANNCDFSGGASAGTKASVRVRAGTFDAKFNGCYMEALATGAYGYLIEGGTTQINGGFIQGGASGSRLQAIVRATGGAKVIVSGMTGQDYFNNLWEADGAGTVIYLMPGLRMGASYTNQIQETNGGRVIDLSAFDPATKMDASYFARTSQAIANGGTYTYQLTSSESVSIQAYLSLNGGFNLYSVTGTAMWVNFGGGSGNSLNNLVSSNAGVTFSINNATGLLTITNSTGLAGQIYVKAQTR